jgi:uncharacterized membrane protein
MNYVREQVILPSGRQPLHPFLAPYAAASFIGALLTDLAYWRTALMMWADFSAWLITIGVLLGVLTLFIWIFDWLTGRLAGFGRPAAMQMLGYLVALILAVFNAMVHTHDAWTSVVPWGLTLSAAMVIALLFSCCMSWVEVNHWRREAVE